MLETKEIIQDMEERLDLEAIKKKYYDEAYKIMTLDEQQSLIGKALHWVTKAYADYGKGTEYDRALTYLAVVLNSRLDHLNHMSAAKDFGLWGRYPWGK